MCGGTNSTCLKFGRKKNLVQQTHLHAKPNPAHILCGIVSESSKSRAFATKAKRRKNMYTNHWSPATLRCVTCAKNRKQQDDTESQRKYKAETTMGRAWRACHAKRQKWRPSHLSISFVCRDGLRRFLVDKSPRSNHVQSVTALSHASEEWLARTHSHNRMVPTW